MKLNRWFKAVRKEKKLTQDNIAKRCGVHKQLISNWERGVSPLANKHIKTITKTFWKDSNERRNNREQVIEFLTQDFRAKIEMEL